MRLKLGMHKCRHCSYESIFRNKEPFYVAESGLDSTSTRSPLPLSPLRFLRWFCGWEEQDQQQEQVQHEQDQHLEALTSLEQSTWQKAVLYLNLIIIIGVAIFFYSYFCFSPFTKEEIDNFRIQAFDRIRNRSQDAP